MDTRCPVCLRLDEDGGHCLVKCKYVRQCWRVLQLEDVRLSLIEMRSSREFIQAILNLQPNTCLAVVLLIWKWWDVRNEVKQSCHEAAHVVAAMTSDLQKEEKGERDRNCINTRRCWSPLLHTLDHLSVDQRVISLLIESNRPRACFGERRQRERDVGASDHRRGWRSSLPSLVHR